MLNCFWILSWKRILRRQSNECTGFLKVLFFYRQARAVYVPVKKDSGVV